jgi:hypothetical protein
MGRDRRFHQFHYIQPFPRVSRPSEYQAVALKLSSKQQTQLAYLETLPPKFQRATGVIELMSSAKADDTAVRGLCRMLDELKANAQALGLPGLADAAGIMGTMARRGGGVQMKVRGLRELLGTLRANYDGARKWATTPERDDPAEEA